MLIDAPSVDEDDEKTGDNNITLTDSNADEVMAMINSINR